MEKKEIVLKEKSKKKDKTKILAIGDIHGDIDLIEKVAKKADEENVDIIILGGDLTFFGELPKGLIGPLIREERQILLIHGNHDGVETIDFLSEMYPNTKNLHNTGFILNDIGFFGAGGADFGRGAMSEKEFNEIIGRSHYLIRDTKRKIMITHMHPEKTKSEFSGVPGSRSIRKAIEKYRPDFALFSHIHGAGGIEEKINSTRAINVSRKMKIFEI